MNNDYLLPILCRKLKRDSIPKLLPALDETDILLLQKEEEVS